MYYRDQSDYAKHLIQNIFPLYFKCWDTFSEYVDEQPYQNAKGIKVDIDKNVKTGLYPCTLLNEPTTLDPSLVSDITDFWRQVCDHVPKNMESTSKNKNPTNSKQDNSGKNKYFGKSGVNRACGANFLRETIYDREVNREVFTCWYKWHVG